MEIGGVALIHKVCTPTQKYPFYRKSAKWLSQCDLKDSMEIQSTGPSYPRDTSSALYILPGNLTSS